MKRRKIVFPVISVLFGILLSLIVLEAMCRVLPVSDSLKALPVNSMNPIMRFEENRDLSWSKGATFTIITRKHVNNYGFLNDQDYSTDDDSPLLAIVGDSYVEAAQVENSKTMHGILSKATAERGRVYSFAAAGSPLSNYLAYARYAATTFHASGIVFIVVENDFDESLTKYKNAPGFHYFSYPSTRLELVRIDYSPTFMKRLSRHSALIRYLVLNIQLNWDSVEDILNNDAVAAHGGVTGYNSAADAERVSDSRMAIDRFFQELPIQTGIGNDRILLVIDGMRPYLYHENTFMKSQGSYFDLMRKYFIEVAAEKGYEIIDMQPIFRKKHESEGMRFEFPSDGHWNEAAHKLVAGEIKRSAVYRTLF